MLHNPSTLYSGGNVALDSSPYLRVALQQRYRRQAMDEAATQYFTKLPEKLNTVGVRNQDMEDPNGNGGIQKDLDDWQNNWATNKGQILRGGTAQQQHMAQFEKIRQKIQQSKDRAKTELLIGKQALQPNGWKPEEEDHPVIDALGKSIYDPASKKQDGVSEYGLNDLSLSAAPYTADTELKHNKAITTGINPERLPQDEGVKDPVTGKVTYNYGYTPEKLRQIAQNTVQDISGNRTLLRHYKRLLSDPKQVEIASNALQTDYDRDHTDGQKVIVDTPEEMAAGLKMAQFAATKVPKEANDYELREFNKRADATLAFQRRKELAMFNDKLIKGRQKDGDVDLSQVGYPTKALDQQFGEDVKLHGSQTGAPMGVKRLIYIDKIPVSTWRTINPQDKNKGVYPIEGVPVKQSDGSVRRAVYVDADGNLVGENDEKIGAEDARNLFIKENVPTKFKLQVNTNKPAQQSAPKSKGKFDNL